MCLDHYTASYLRQANSNLFFNKDFKLRVADDSAFSAQNQLEDGFTQMVINLFIFSIFCIQMLDAYVCRKLLKMQDGLGVCHFFGFPVLFRCFSCVSVMY